MKSDDKMYSVELSDLEVCLARILNAYETTASMHYHRGNPDKYHANGLSNSYAIQLIRTVSLESIMINAPTIDEATKFRFKYKNYEQEISYTIQYDHRTLPEAIRKLNDTELINFLVALYDRNRNEPGDPNFPNMQYATLDRIVMLLDYEDDWKNWPQATKE